jgi:hypothetical protein
MDYQKTGLSYDKVDQNRYEEITKKLDEVHLQLETSMFLDDAKHNCTEHFALLRKEIGLLSLLFRKYRGRLPAEISNNIITIINECNSLSKNIQVRSDKRVLNIPEELHSKVMELYSVVHWEIIKIVSKGIGVGGDNIVRR